MIAGGRGHTNERPQKCDGRSTRRQNIVRSPVLPEYLIKWPCGRIPQNVCLPAKVHLDTARAMKQVEKRRMPLQPKSRKLKRARGRKKKKTWRVYRCQRGPQNTKHIGAGRVIEMWKELQGEQRERVS